MNLKLKYPKYDLELKLLNTTFIMLRKGSEEKRLYPLTITRLIGTSVWNLNYDKTLTTKDIISLHKTLSETSQIKLNIVYILTNTSPDSLKKIFIKQAIEVEKVNPGYKLINDEGFFTLSVFYYQDFFETYYPSLILNKSNILYNTLFIFDGHWSLFKFVSRLCRFPIGGGSNNKKALLSDQEFFLSYILNLMGFKREDIRKSFNSNIKDLELKGSMYYRTNFLTKNLIEKEFSNSELISFTSQLIRYPQDLEIIPVWLLNQIIIKLKEILYSEELTLDFMSGPKQTMFLNMIGINNVQDLTFLIQAFTNFKNLRENLNK